jgi:phosphate/sulfate permease
MSDLPPSRSNVFADPRRFVELFTAVLALVIIVGSFIMIGVAFNYINATDDQFGRAKDILLFVNPILGIVIGYYFNKVTSDARADTAEKAAQTAVNSAQQAREVRDEAVGRAQEATSMAKEIRSTLEEVTQAASEMVEQVAAAPADAASGTLSFGDLGGNGAAVPSEASIKTRLELQSALARAQKVLNK